MKAFNITELLIEAYKMNASDVHLSVDTPPIFRVYGDLVPQVKYEPYKSEELMKLIGELLKSVNIPFNKKEIDFSFGLENIARVRANVFWKGEI